MPESTILSELLFLLIGLLLGGGVVWWIAKFRFSANQISLEEVQKKYVLKEIFDHLQAQADINREDLLEKEAENRQLSNTLASLKEQLRFLQEKLDTQKQEITELQHQARLEFENVANRLLEEKSQKFSLQNQENLDSILQPLREKIKEFTEDTEKKFIEETKQRFSLQQEIESLRDLNTQLSQEAHNLVYALKGDNKFQGDWGEFQLEVLLEKAGLKRDVHYRAQSSFRDHEGQQKRPDFIINLPDGKHLVLDSKVSLAAYERYFQAETEEERRHHLQEHCHSIRRHIKQLGSQNYQYLHQINSPDYLLLFIPIEPAFFVATQSDSKLFLDALDSNVVIVTSSTLLATLRTVASIWKQENQKQYVLEIVRQSGMLYDKFCSFVENLQDVGQRLEQAQYAYRAAMNKLVQSPHRGTTLIGRVERLKELGAQSSKSLPTELLNWNEDNGEEEVG